MARRRRFTNYPVPRASGPYETWRAAQLKCWSSPIRGTGFFGPGGDSWPHPIPAWTLSVEDQGTLAGLVAAATAGPSTPSSERPDTHSIYAGIRFSDPSVPWPEPEWAPQQLEGPPTVLATVPGTAAAIWPQFVVYAGVLRRYDGNAWNPPYPTWSDAGSRIEAWLLESAVAHGQGAWYSGTRLREELHLPEDLRGRLRRWSPDDVGRGQTLETAATSAGDRRNPGLLECTTAP